MSTKMWHTLKYAVWLNKHWFKFHKKRDLFSLTCCKYSVHYGIMLCKLSHLTKTTFNNSLWSNIFPPEITLSMHHHTVQSLPKISICTVLPQQSILQANLYFRRLRYWVESHIVEILVVFTLHKLAKTWSVSVVYHFVIFQFMILYEQCCEHLSAAKCFRAICGILRIHPGCSQLKISFLILEPITASPCVFEYPKPKTHRVEVVTSH